MKLTRLTSLPFRNEGGNHVNPKRGWLFVRTIKLEAYYIIKRGF